ncbi:MAG: T9SS type A sorting domain-containing protein, partial [Chitinophagales bacterium]|nr:T9SS type A sorting domain-containing protein [Chitinophagales bacterium]
NSSSFTTTLAGGDIVTCVMTSNSACASVPTANSNSLTITSAVTPTIAINSPTTSICAGESLTFTASITNGGSNPSLQWFKNGFAVSGQNGTSYSSSSFINGDQIYCELTSNAPCANPTKVNSNTKTITIVTSVVPSVSISTTTTTICAGTNLTFTASPGNGGSAPTYQWKINGSNIGSPSTTATFSSSTLANNDAVTCLMVSNSACASTPNASSNTLNMTVNPNLVPSVTVSPSPGSTICSGSAITFTASPTNGGASPTYSWTIDGNAQASTTSVMGKTFTNAGTSPIQATIIATLNVSPGTCVTTNSALSSPMIVTINPILTPSIVVSTPVTSICQGTNTTFTATPTNCGATPAYQWKVNGINAGLNSTSFSSTSLANGDIVTCSVTPGGGCFSASTANSNSINMTVNSVKIPTASISNPNTTICQGTNATFTATITNGGSNPTYQWKLNGANVGLNSNIYSNATLVNGDQVQVVLTSDAVCATPLTVNSNTIPMIIKAKPAKSTVTKLNATTLQSSEIGDSYQWKKDGTTLAPATRNITVTALGDYTVAVILSGCSSDVSDPLTFIPTSSIKTFDEIGIKVYPNPVSDRIFVEMPNGLLSKNNTIKFYSVSGQTIEIENQLTKTKNGFEITTENMSSGIYVIELENESGKAIYRVNIVK